MEKFVFDEVENIVEKSRKMVNDYKHFLLFPQCFQRAFFSVLLNCGIVILRVNPFPNTPWFLHVSSRSLLKTLWVKEKLLVMRNFSFFHFYPFEELPAISIKFENERESATLF